MFKGYNSDINVRGTNYHIQTEDWGIQNPFLVTRVFSNGAVMKTIKRSYDEVLRSSSVRMDKAIEEALRKQHSDIIDTLMSGASI